jgi:hypothetical protein
MVYARQSLPRAKSPAPSPIIKWKRHASKSKDRLLSSTLEQGAMCAGSCPYLGGDSSRLSMPPE